MRFMLIMTKQFCFLTLGCLVLIYCDTPNQSQPDLYGYSFVGLDTLQWNLDDALLESSGIMKIGKEYWSHNDSGDSAFLYQFDPVSGVVNRKLELDGVENKDWEDLTQDDKFIYVGNFGNNLGKRSDLSIYKFSKDQLDSSKVQNISTIEFSFPDQKNFANSYNHNFDVESVLAIGDSLYLFTKNWQDKACKLYSVPKQEGSYEAEYISSLNTKGLITSAAYDSIHQRVVLLGYNYNNYNTPFVWVLSKYSGNDIFSGTNTRFNFDLDRQTEAICFDGNNSYIITAEKGNNKSASTFRLNL